MAYTSISIVVLMPHSSNAFVDPELRLLSIWSLACSSQVHGGARRSGMVSCPIQGVFLGLDPDLL